MPSSKAAERLYCGRRYLTTRFETVIWRLDYRGRYLLELVIARSRSVIEEED